MDTLRSQFFIRPEVAFLNFGSFGACPRPVFEDYQRWQRELEEEPVQFITVNGPRYLRESREALAEYIRCNADDIVYVMNPSYAVNIIAKSLNLSPGDEILTTNLEYGACDKAWNHYCKKSGAKYVRQPVSLPVASQEQIIEEVKKGITKNTKMLFISHITSSTGMILPVKALCDWAKSQGLLTFVDGAHAPGQIPLDLGSLNADIYTGACHKWMMAPKGCSFLYVKREYQGLFDPLIISWGYDSPITSGSLFQDYHQVQGTRDFSAFLTVPKAIEFMRDYQWEKVSAECRAMVRNNAQRFFDLLNTKPICPVNEAFIAQMLSIRIQTPNPDKLKAHLFDEYQVEVPVMVHEDKVFLRYSIQGFNTQKDLDRLYDALVEVLSEGELLSSF